MNNYIKLDAMRESVKGGLTYHSPTYVNLAATGNEISISKLMGKFSFWLVVNLLAFNNNPETLNLLRGYALQMSERIQKFGEGGAEGIMYNKLTRKFLRGGISCEEIKSALRRKDVGNAADNLAWEVLYAIGYNLDLDHFIYCTLRLSRYIDMNNGDNYFSDDDIKTYGKESRRLRKKFYKLFCD